MTQLDPTARDFETLVQQLRSRVQKRFNHLQTDITDAGFVGMLIDLFAAVGDGLHFQLDNALHELFWDTDQRSTSSGKAGRPRRLPTQRQHSSYRHPALYPGAER